MTSPYAQVLLRPDLHEPAAPAPGVIAARPPLAPARARIVLGAALAAGVVGDAVSSAGLWGLGLSCYLLAVVAALAVVGASGATARRRPGQLRLLMVGATLAALLLLLRESELLAGLNTIAALGALVLAVLLMAPGSTLDLRTARLRDLVRLLPFAALYGVLGAALYTLVDFKSVFRRGSRGDAALGGAAGADAAAGDVASHPPSTTGAIARALLLATSLVLGLGLLLAGSDPVFQRATSWLVDWNLPWLSRHLTGTLLLTWPVLGLLWGATRPLAAASPRSLLGDVALNRLDVLSALVAMNALFALFIALQMRVLFGGQAYLLATTGLTVAEYARSGFFTLTFTVAVVVGVLLAMNALLRHDSLAAWRVSRRLSQLLLLLLGGVLVSAVTRMLLYVDAFGLTIDRIVAFAAIGWIASVGVVFALTVLRDRPARFVAGAMAMAAATLLMLNVANPDALVVRSAIEQAARGRAVDDAYLAGSLSADAVPLLASAVASGLLDGVPSAATTTAGTTADTTADTAAVPGAPVKTPARTPACRAADNLLQLLAPNASRGATSWTLSRARAERAVRTHEHALRRRACVTPSPASSSRPR